jgi:hypothetical protein
MLNCQNCGEEIEPGAAFCGNCGHPVVGTNPAPQATTPNITQAPVAESVPVVQPPQAQPIPAAPYIQPVRQSGETMAIVALIVAVLALPLALFPVFGLILGGVGLALSIQSRIKIKRTLNLVGVVFGCLAIVLSIGVWGLGAVYEEENQNKAVVAKDKQTVPANQVTDSQSLSTPCYKMSVGLEFDIDNNSGSCNTVAQHNKNNEIYVVESAPSGRVTSDNFASISEQALEGAISSQVTNSVITGKRNGTFSGAQAFYMTAHDDQGGYADMAAVLHVGTAGSNYYVIGHISDDPAVNLRDLETSWQWH